MDHESLSTQLVPTFLAVTPPIHFLKGAANMSDNPAKGPDAVGLTKEGS